MSNASTTSNVIALPEPGTLLKYEAACRAVAEAQSVDEVKLIHDQAAALKAYARQAKDEQLMKNAMRIRHRAEHRLCQMIEAQARTIGLAKGARERGTTRGTERPTASPPTLAEAGIDKNLAKRARSWKDVSDDEVAAEIEARIVKLFDPPPPKPRNGDGITEVTPSPEQYFLEEADRAAQTSRKDYRDLVVSDEILAAAKRAAQGWATCVKQLEERRRLVLHLARVRLERQARGH